MFTKYKYFEEFKLNCTIGTQYYHNSCTLIKRDNPSIYITLFDVMFDRIFEIDRLIQISYRFYYKR